MPDSLRLISQVDRILKQKGRDTVVTIACENSVIFKGIIKSHGDGYILVKLLDGTEELIHPNSISSVNVG